MCWYKKAKQQEELSWWGFLKGLGITSGLAAIILPIIISLKTPPTQVEKIIRQNQGNETAIIEDIKNITVQSIPNTVVTEPKSIPAQEKNDQLTSNFSLSEFASKDGSSIPEKYLPNVQELAKNLQVLSNAIRNRQIVINSGYRSPRHNSSVGGAKESQHLLGTAADITVEGMKPKDVKNLIEQLIAAGQMKQGGLGLYPTFVHYDIRGNRKRW